ncbi:hypothetical protein LCO01nite_08190 [Lapidilactobacillus concavus]|nr:hypothetical protein LCO01nite_08190 [Lapidilactobacillus concavus]
MLSEIRKYSKKKGSRKQMGMPCPGGTPYNIIRPIIKNKN